MAGCGRAELESLKSYLTSANDNAIRLAYDRRPSELPRRLVAIPIAPGPGGPSGLRDYLDGNRDQIWAEALHRVKAGENARLPDELKAAQRAINEKHRHSDEILEDAVASALNLNPEWETDGVPLVKLMKQLPGDPLDPGNSAHGRRVGNILKNQGWEKTKKRVDGAVRPVWLKSVAP